MISAAKPKDVIIAPKFDPDKIGSIYLPQESRQRCTQGIVKYIGREVTEVKVGDRVGFGGYSGTLAKLDGEGVFIIMPESEIDFIFGPISDYEFPIYFRADQEEFEKEVKEVVKYLHTKLDGNPTIEEAVRYGMASAPFYKMTYEQIIHLLTQELPNVPEHQAVVRNVLKDEVRMVNHSKTYESKKT